MYILDTNAVIYYVKEESNVVSVIEDIYTKNVPVYLSVITEAELFGFPQLSDEEAERIVGRPNWRFAIEQLLDSRR
jgi:predicted nucleic acid-binding protein